MAPGQDRAGDGGRAGKGRAGKGRAGKGRAGGGRGPPAGVSPDSEDDLLALTRRRMHIESLGGDVHKALYEAVQWGDMQMAADALNVGADPLCAHSSRHLTPLHVVAQSGNADLLHLLLRHPSAPAMIEARTWDGETPLSRAVRAGQLAATQALVNAGSSVNVADNHGQTPLVLAEDARRQDLVDFLVASGATR